MLVRSLQHLHSILDSEGYLEIETQNWREYLVSEDQRQQDGAEDSMHTASNLFQDNLSSMMIKKDIEEDSNFDEQLVSICKEIAVKMKDEDNMERLRRHLKGGFDTNMGDFEGSDLEDLRSLIGVMIETSTSQPSLVIDDFAKV
ncbi:hypothetical protein GUITHDRAFT_116991 [Guillardia theta CCMP2712]|uniref:Uncharacterized protein n=1 Tax=Guillardia theta (strain CCMP2712) TaxID=905079 RepID=L1IM10_GUITC|nr:hypothetical protein GUITHDRAFT_116991 [Guillardia theta CCMP2712]EKX36825.1 hypothetical protein GUITHDRAFT_116991 [Guillardia theta CCMP2712]|eukprot:XP_005823805.1 hypothetical protein GUITHDRAFT_116991 [Guillardia theta CCMP2712]